MKYSSILVFFFLALPCVLSQNARQPHDRVSLKVTPTSMFNANTATILFAAEVRPIEQIGLQFEYGWQFNDLALLNWNTEKKDWDYAKYRGEVRWYPQRIDEISFYVASGFLIIPQRYTKAPGYVVLNDTPYRYDSSRISKDAWVIFLNGGFKTHFTQYFFMEFYGGLGFKKLTISHQPDGLMMEQLPFREWVPAPKDEKEGSWNLPFVDCGVKLGISFGKVNNR